MGARTLPAPVLDRVTQSTSRPLSREIRRAAPLPCHPVRLRYGKFGTNLEPVRPDGTASRRHVRAMIRTRTASLALAFIGEDKPVPKCPPRRGARRLPQRLCVPGSHERPAVAAAITEAASGNDAKLPGRLCKGAVRCTLNTPPAASSSTGGPSHRFHGGVDICAQQGIRTVWTRAEWQRCGPTRLIAHPGAVHQRLPAGGARSHHLGPPLPGHARRGPLRRPTKLKPAPPLESFTTRFAHP